MIDCFDGLVVSWSIGTRPDAKLVNSMLDAAVEKAYSGKRQIAWKEVLAGQKSFESDATGSGVGKPRQAQTHSR